MGLSPYALSIAGEPTKLQRGDYFRIIFERGFVSFWRPGTKGPSQTMQVHGSDDKMLIGVNLDLMSARSIAWIIAASVGLSVEETSERNSELQFKLV